MAGLIVDPDELLGSPRMITANVTVQGIDAGNNVRTVLVYRNGSRTEVYASAVTASDGTTSLQLNGNHNDVYRFVALGIEGIDNSAISDHVRESS